MENLVIRAIGLMSGTSLDGLDILLADFSFKGGQWSYNIVLTETISYNSALQGRLSGAMALDGRELAVLDRDFGVFCGQAVRKFLNEKGTAADLLCSHGHTIFHDPKMGLTLQIGSGQHLSAIVGLPVINDFRTLDVALGGQGAPLVPIGDALLFSDYEYCLNLGGFANISFNENHIRKAFDIAPCNIVLNRLASETGLPYDESGKIAREGKVIDELLLKLNALPYYHQNKPKSLGREWVEENFWPLLTNNSHPIPDKMRTVVQHVCEQISASVSQGKLLCTGGGAHNQFLIERIRSTTKCEVIVPETKIVDFKEALIFAFLGVLKIYGENNVLASVTGAERDSSSGVMHGDFRKLFNLISGKS